MRVALAAGLDLRNLLDKCAQLTGFKQDSQGQFNVTSLTHAGNDLRSQQRVPTQGEEVVIEANSGLPQHFAPDCGDALLQFSLRLDVLAHVPHRLRQGPAIKLATRAQGHAFKAQQLRGDHIIRQFGG